MRLYSRLLFISIYFLGCWAGDGDVNTTPGTFRTIQTGPKALWSETTLDKLKKDLFINYDKYTRPYQHPNITEVHLGVYITYLETEEVKSTITFHGSIRLIWNDPKLKWDVNDYSGVDVIRLADHEMWQPDIYLYNSVLGGEPIIRFGNPNAIVYSNGNVLWVFPTKLTALCEFNLRHWPFDTQHCHFKFGSWTHSGNEIKLKLNNPHRGANLEHTISYSTWNVSNTTAEVITKYYDCCSEPYYSVQFNLTLTRKSDSYKAVIISPAVVNALLILMQFWLPPQAQEKLVFNCFVIIVLIMFLIVFINQSAAAGANTPLIVLFYTWSLYILSFAMVGNIVAFWLSRSNKAQPLIRTVRKYSGANLGKWFFLELKLREAGLIKSTVKGCQITSFITSHCSHEQEWILAEVFNRVLFIIYSVVFLIFGIVYLI